MNKFLLSLTLIITLFYACSDPSSVGAGLLEGEDLVLDYTDSVQLNIKTVLEDSIYTLNSNTNMIGSLQDPVFGDTECIVYVNSRFADSQPGFDGADLDSLIMVLPLDTFGYYGELNTNHEIEVFQLDEYLITTIENIGVDSFISSTEIPINEDNFLGSISIVPNYIDSVDVYDPNFDTTNREPAQLRIPLKTSFGQAFINRDTLVSSDSIYQEEVKGFAIRSTSSGSSTLGFNLGRGTSKLFYYYTKTDTIPRSYAFDIGTTSFQYYNHSFSSEITNAVDSPDEEKLYVGSMAGPNIEIDLSPIFQFEDVIINHATLDLYLNEEGDDLESYPPVMYFIANFKTSSGALIPIVDVDQSSFAALERSFGGQLTEDEATGKQMYSFQISSHVVSLLNGTLGEDISNSIFLRPLSKSERPFRSVIHGNDNTEFKPRLKLVITNP